MVLPRRFSVDQSDTPSISNDSNDGENSIDPHRNARGREAAIANGRALESVHR